MNSFRMRSWLLSAAIWMGHFPVSLWAVWWHHWRYGWTPTGSSACAPFSSSQSARSKWPKDAAMYSATCSWNLEKQDEKKSLWCVRLDSLLIYMAQQQFSRFYSFLTSLLASSVIGGSELSIYDPGGNPGGTSPTHPMCPNGEWCLCWKTKNCMDFKINVFYYNFRYVCAWLWRGQKIMFHSNMQNCDMFLCLISLSWR